MSRTFKIVHETTVEIDDEWFDEDGNLTHIDNTRMVGGARPLSEKLSRAPADVLERLIREPAFTLGQVPKVKRRAVKITETRKASS